MAIRDYLKAGIEVIQDFTDLVKAKADNDNNSQPVQAQPVQKATEDPKTLFFDPYAIIEQLGYKDKPTSITYGTLWQMFLRMPIVQAIVILRMNQVASFAQPQQDKYSLGFRVALRDKDKNATKQELAWINQMNNVLMTTGVTDNPKGRESFKTFLKKIVVDTLIYDQLCFEVVNNRKGQPAEWYATDATTMRIADNSSTYIDEDNVNDIRYVQIYDGVVINEYTADEMVFGVRHPNTNIRLQGYGISELELLITTVTGLLNAHDFNQKFFTQGSTAKGIINFKGTIPNRQLQEFRRHWYNLLSSVQNCVAGNTMLWTPEGGYTIERVLEEVQEKEVPVWTGETWRNALVYKTNEKKELCHTVLNNNIQLDTSPDHRFRVICEDGELGWKKQSELKVGDWVAVNNKIVENKNFEIPKYKGKPISLEFMEILGWMTGDGSIGDRKVSLFYNSKEHDLRDEHLKVLREYDSRFVEDNIDLTEEQVKRDIDRSGVKTINKHRRYININSIEFSNWLFSLGFEKKKVIPSFVYSMPYEYKQKYLKGFFSADGNNQKGRHPCITITDSKLREQTKLLLISVGIRTCLAEQCRLTGFSKPEEKGKHKDKILRIKDKQRFFDEIGFIQGHKQPVEPVSKKEVGKNNRITKSTIKKYLLEVRKNNDAFNKKILTDRERMDMNSILCGIDGCSLNRLLFYMDKAGVRVPDWMVSYSFEPVVSLENTGEKVQMYDVQVYDNEHQFSGNGVILHNSWKTPIVNSEDLQYINLQQSHRDMEFNAWMDFLIKEACGVYAVDPAEINFNYGNTGQSKALVESSSMEKIMESKERGLRPLLNDIGELISKHIVTPLNEDFCFEFVGLDAETKDKVVDRNMKRVKSFITVDELRAEEDRPPLPDGQGAIILDPTFLQNKQASAYGGGEEEGMEQGDEENGENEDQDIRKLLSQYGGGEENQDNEEKNTEKSMTWTINL